MIEVDGRSLSWHEGMTVSDVLEKIGQPDRYAVVRVNQDYVARPHFKSFQVPDGASLHLIPMIAGG